MKVKVKSLEECLKIDKNLDSWNQEDFEKHFAGKEIEIMLPKKYRIDGSNSSIRIAFLEISTPEPL